MTDSGNENAAGAISNEGISRRRFVQGAAGGIAAIGLGGALRLPDALAAPAAKHGGTLRVGIIGGGQAESLDPNISPAEVDVLRDRALFEGLVEFDSHGHTVNQLAAELVPNKSASVWTIKLRKGVRFHNGKQLTADDLIYCLHYFLNPKNKSLNYSLLAPALSASGIHKVDKHTVKLVLKRPNSLLPQVLAERTVKIYPAGSTAKQLATHPIGTGPFKFGTYVRNERSLFPRNPHWFARGAFGPAYFDALEVLAINDPTARVNALTAGQVDAVSDIGTSLAPTVQRNHSLHLIEGPSGAFTEFYMDTTAAPFKDNRVRTAFKLMMDRQQMISNTLSGHGRLGNDLPSWFDPNYGHEIPQRAHDPEQAKALLKKAGATNLTVPLVTADFATAALTSATLLASQAKAAGVTINLQTIPGDQFYSTYPRSPMGMSNWGGRPFVPFAQYAFVPGAPDNETRWSDAKWNKVFFAALRTTQAAKRRELLVEAQRIIWEDGGYLIWGFPNSLDATSAKVKGLVPSPIRPLQYYDFSHAYFA